MVIILPFTASRQAPALRWLWKEEATEAVIEFLEGTRIGCWVSSRRALVDEDRDREEGPGRDGEEGEPGPPQAVFSFVSFLYHLSTFLCPSEEAVGDREAPV